MTQANQLAHYPFVESDYRLVDDDGRKIEHLLVDGLVFSYWLDHVNQLVLITKIEDANSG